jgi:hypothetical protein
MKQVIVVNRSLRLPKSKLAAQVAHAALGAFITASARTLNRIALFDISRASKGRLEAMAADPHPNTKRRAVTRQWRPSQPPPMSQARARRAHQSRDRRERRQPDKQLSSKSCRYGADVTRPARGLLLEVGSETSPAGRCIPTSAAVPNT